MPNPSPKNLDQVTAAAPEDVEIAGMGIGLPALLNRKRQASHAAAHIGGDPDSDAARNRNHRRRKAQGPAAAPQRQRHVDANTTAIELNLDDSSPCTRRGGKYPSCGAPVEIRAATGVVATGTRAGAASPPSRPWRACRRQVNRRLRATSCRRAPRRPSRQATRSLRQGGPSRRNSIAADARAPNKLNFIPDVISKLDLSSNP